MRIYINGEYCSSVEQLKWYFSENLTPESDIYLDLLDYGRHGDITVWLREMNETKLASNVDAIDTGLCDSAFYAQLKSIITGNPVLDTAPLKPSFDRCFSFEDLKCDVQDTKAKVYVILKVLLCVNEEYELRVSSDWGMRAMIINPYSYPEGKLANFEFSLHKRPGKNLGEITLYADENKLSFTQSSSNPSLSTESKDCKIKSDSQISTDEDKFSLAQMSTGNQDGPYREFTVRGVTFKMIRVEGGTFTMGATSEQGRDASDDEKPTRSVTLKNYYIGETEVTQELWQAVMGTNPSKFKNRGRNLPVEQVSWKDCQKFISKLNSITGLQFQLPMEAQWEYAARGGNKSKGYKYSGGDDVGSVAWYTDNSGSQPHPVKIKQPNELGIYDMTGNVWEWCQDKYDFYSRKYQTYPIGASSESQRVFRGGSWNNSAKFCRVSCRGSNEPSWRYYRLGLRLVLSE